MGKPIVGNNDALLVWTCFGLRGLRVVVVAVVVVVVVATTVVASAVIGVVVVVIRAVVIVEVLVFCFLKTHSASPFVATQF